jgi:transketolase N-terminal domain/subunit
MKAGIDQGSHHDGGIMAMQSVIRDSYQWTTREPVHEDKGKTMALEPEDGKDPKRAHVVLSKGHQVVRPGYSRVTGVAAKVTEKKENLGNHGWVNYVSKTKQHYPSWVNRVS